MASVDTRWSVLQSLKSALAVMAGYWISKLYKNVKRFDRNIVKLRKLNWTVVVIWECEIINPKKLLKSFKSKIKNQFKLGELFCGPGGLAGRRKQYTQLPSCLLYENLSACSEDSFG